MKKLYTRKELEKKLNAVNEKNKLELKMQIKKLNSEKIKKTAYV